MDFAFTETQLALQDTARRFAEGRLKPLVARMDAESHYEGALLEELGELGFFGLTAPEEHGGIGADPVSYALVIEELAKVCPSTAVMLAVHNSLINEVLNKRGTQEQKAKWLPLTASGKAIGAFAITESGAGSDAAGTRTRAVRDGDHYVLDGTKTFITNADFARLFVVFALTTPGARTRGISAFLVEKGTPGFELGKKEDKMGLRASSTRELVFTEARVPAANLIGAENEGFKVAMTLLDGGRIGIAAQSLGIAEAALREGLSYSRERQQFDKPICEFQAVGTMLADSATDVEAARLLVYRAAWLKAQGQPHSLEASMAKLFASEAANRVANRCLQIHGGYGYTKDYPIERIYRDQRITQIYEGTSEIQRHVISRLLVNPK